MSKVRRAATMVALCMIAGPVSSADRVIGWRGDGSGNFLDATPPTRFSEQENLRWKAAVGQGCGAAIVVGERLFVQAAPNALICLDKATGKELWHRDHHAGQLDPQSAAARLDAAMDQVGALHALAQRAAALPRDAANRAELEAEVQKTEARLSKDVLANLPGAKLGGYSYRGIYLICMTPCSDGRKVVAVFPTGIAVAYDLEGKWLWSTAIRPPAERPKELDKGKWRPIPGTLSTCPVFTAEGVVVAIYGVLTVGIEAATGKVLWQAFGEVSHCSPVAGRVGGESLVARGDYDILRARDGLKVHDDPRAPSGDCSVSPVFADGVFHWVTHAVKVTPGDPPRAEVLWAWEVETLREMSKGGGGAGFPYGTGVARLTNVDFTSPVVVDGKLLYYGWGVMSVLEAATGKKLAQPRIPRAGAKPLSHGVTKNWAYGGMVRAGDHLILAHDNGLVKIFPINDTFSPMQTCALPDDIYAQPACDGPALYLRTLNALYCFGDALEKRTKGE